MHDEHTRRCGLARVVPCPPELGTADRVRRPGTPHAHQPAHGQRRPSASPSARDRDRSEERSSPVRVHTTNQLGAGWSSPRCHKLRRQPNGGARQSRGSVSARTGSCGTANGASWRQPLATFPRGITGAGINAGVRVVHRGRGGVRDGSTSCASYTGGGCGPSTLTRVSGRQHVAGRT